MSTWVPSALRADVRFIVQDVILPKRTQGANMNIFVAFDMIVVGHARKFAVPQRYEYELYGFTQLRILVAKNKRAEQYISHGKRERIWTEMSRRHKTIEFGISKIGSTCECNSCSCDEHKCKALS